MPTVRHYTTTGCAHRGEVQAALIRGCAHTFICPGDEGKCPECGLPYSIREDTAPSWSPEWPTELGWYWFCGNAHKSWGGPALIAVEVATVGGQPMCVGPGYELLEDESTGLWFPLSTPELPEEVS